jgi:argininosuccinate lyase
MPGRWSEDYVAHVLRPNFAQAKRYLFKPLMLVNKAHAVMLENCALLTHDDASALLSALEEIDRTGSRAYAYNEAYEDLYFAIEAKLIELTGAEVGGNLQIARSRNDIDAAMIRMVVREAVLGLLEVISELRSVILSRSLEFVAALMPGYTHNQPAQPTTLAHYFGATLACLERDAERLRAAYKNVNRNPLGAAAMTTTSFPIRRDITERLLGFEGLEENGINAVGGADHTLEAVSATMLCAISLSRTTFDLMTWTSREVGFLRVPDKFVQISSIMPQKRNPVVLEHIRAKLSRTHGAAQTVFNLARNIPYGDVNDVGEPMLEPVLRCFTEADEAISLLAAVLEGAHFNVEQMEQRAGEHFTTATGLADHLVAECGLPFRQAHHVASRVVDLAYQRGLGFEQVNAALVNEAALDRLGKTLELSEASVRLALDPRAFVEARKLPGGPAREAMLPFLSRAQGRLEEDESWRRAALRRLRAARDELEHAIQTILEPEPIGEQENETQRRSEQGSV